MATKRRPMLGAVTDNPREIMSLAIEEFRAAKTHMGQRQAAEKAHLALTSAVEVATRSAITSYSEELRAVTMIGTRSKDSYLKHDYLHLRKVLHGECFHQAKCGSAEALGDKFVESRIMVERILRTRSPKRR